MFSYGLGDAGTGLVATQFGFFLFKFFISAGLPVIIAGSLLIISEEVFGAKNNLF